MSAPRLVVDWTRCDAHGVCAGLLPELVGLDDWGYPVVADDVPDDLLDHVRRAVSGCPAAALRIVSPGGSR